MNNSELTILSLNMAGWCWKGTEKWEMRLQRICKYIKENIKNIFILAFQEVQLSGGRHLNEIKNVFTDFEIVLPYGYDNQPKSVVSIILINKHMCCYSYSLRTIDGLEDSLRYNYVTLNAIINKRKLCFQVLNVNIPHLNNDGKAKWYQEARKAMRETFVQRIKEEAETYRTEPDIKFICLGDFNTLPGDVFLQELVETYINRPMFDAIADTDKNTPTWISANGSNRLDYLLYSSGMLCDTGIRAKRTIVDDTPISQNMSDHVLLVGGLFID